MTKCPHCGSTAQVKLLGEDYSYEWEYKIVIIRDYKCGCGTYFRGTIYFYQHGYEMIDKEEHL